jgi:hypothetical protein
MARAVTKRGAEGSGEHPTMIERLSERKVEATPNS